MNILYLFMFCAFFGGCILPLQAGINAQLGRHLGHPLIASFISFSVGTVALFLLMNVLGVKLPTMSQFQGLPLWMWIGGLLGAFFVTATILLAPKLGATTMIAFIIAGQLSSAVLLDHFGWVGYAAHPVSPMRLVGIGLLLVGMILIQRF